MKRYETMTKEQIIEMYENNGSGHYNVKAYLEQEMEQKARYETIKTDDDWEKG